MGMHTYDDDCEITWENLADNVDHYFACHLISWFLVGFVIRDAKILYIWQGMHELIELSW